MQPAVQVTRHALPAARLELKNIIGGGFVYAPCAMVSLGAIMTRMSRAVPLVGGCVGPARRARMWLNRLFHRLVTYGDRLAATSPAFFCLICYGPLHYDAAGRLLRSDYSLFPYSAADDGNDY